MLDLLARMVGVALSQDAQEQARDAFSWLGTLADAIAVISAVAAIIAWRRARQAATEAQQAVQGLRERMRRIETYAAAVDLSRELRRLISAQQAYQWQAALDCYDKVRPLVVQVRSGQIKLLSDVQQAKLTNVSAELIEIATEISTALHSDKEAIENLNVARYNSFIAGIEETIEEILVRLRESA